MGMHGVHQGQVYYPQQQVYYPQQHQQVYYPQQQQMYYPQQQQQVYYPQQHQGHYPHQTQVYQHPGQVYGHRDSYGYPQQGHPGQWPSQHGDPNGNWGHHGNRHATRDLLIGSAVVLGAMLIGEAIRNRH